MVYEAILSNLLNKQGQIDIGSRFHGSKDFTPSDGFLRLPAGIQQSIYSYLMPILVFRHRFITSRCHHEVSLVILARVIGHCDYQENQSLYAHHSTMGHHRRAYIYEKQAQGQTHIKTLAVSLPCGSSDATCIVVEGKSIAPK